eukprot:14426985-Alexandrium_andersonii.AAC.1
MWSTPAATCCSCTAAGQCLSFLQLSGQSLQVDGGSRAPSLACIEPGGLPLLALEEGRNLSSPSW